MRSPLDLDFARNGLWYRVPVEQARRLKDRWPPEWLAFYQTQVFGAEAHSINYYGRVVDVREVARYELFPDEPRDDRSAKRYYQLFLDSLLRRPNPIRSRRLRRIVFIPTTWKKFTLASEVNDLFDESPLEDRLWNEFKTLGIPAERQELVEVTGQAYFLDFAIYCASGSLAVETDGDAWHANSGKARADNRRDNDLQANGWKLLRFGTSQVRDELADYCVPKIVDAINAMGGLDEGAIPRRIPVKQPDGSYQTGLFDPK